MCYIHISGDVSIVVVSVEGDGSGRMFVLLVPTELFYFRQGKCYLHIYLG